jgi:N-acetylneuraminic acid mutarotase
MVHKPMTVLLCSAPLPGFAEGGAMRAKRTIVVTILASIGLIACLGSEAAAQSSSSVSLEWAKSTPLPEARAGYASGIVDGKLVIAGGTYWDGTEGHWIKRRYSASTDAFDPMPQRWEKLPDLPIALGDAASTVVDDRLFVLGGFTGSGVNRKIFTLAKVGNRYVWSVVGEMDFDRVFASAVSVKRLIYLVGGATSFEAFDSVGTCCATNTVTNTLLVFDTGAPTKGWRQLAPYPGLARWMPAAATDGKSIWLFGGVLQADVKAPVTNFDEVLRYDFARESWSVAPALPKAITDLQPLCSLKIGDRILLFTGEKKVWQLDLRTQHYSETTPMPEAVAVDQFFWLHHRIIGAGGESEVERPRRRSDWTFDAKITSGTK